MEVSGQLQANSSVICASVRLTTFVDYRGHILSTVIIIIIIIIIIITNQVSEWMWKKAVMSEENYENSESGQSACGATFEQGTSRIPNTATLRSYNVRNVLHFP